MGILILLLFTTLTWTNPTHDAYPGPDSCNVHIWLNTDLHHIEVWGARRWEPVTLLAVVPAAGRQGLRDSVVVDVGTEGAGWIVAVDDSGNRSCTTPFDAFNKPVSVPLPPPTIVRLEWFDVMGRRIIKPEHPGVYFLRINGRPTRTIHIIRRSNP